MDYKLEQPQKQPAINYKCL